jgi:hypothetical protein
MHIYCTCRIYVYKYICKYMNVRVHALKDGNGGRAKKMEEKERKEGRKEGDEGEGGRKGEERGAYSTCSQEGQDFLML